MIPKYVMKPARTLLWICIALATACSGTGKRSVVEEIPSSELNRLLIKRPDYQTAIVVAGRFREQASEIERAKASELTYDRLYEFLDAFYDDTLRLRLGEEGARVWREKYGTTYARVDSLVASWQEFLDNHRPENYVKVELVSIDPAESTFGTARVVLNVVPLQGAVDKVAGSFGIFLRGRSHSFGEFSSARHNRFEFGNGLKQPQSSRTWMHYNVWEIRDGDIPYNMFPENKGLPLGELLEKYDFDYTVTELVKDGKSIDYANIRDSVPTSVRNLLNDPQREVRKELLYGRIVRELIDPDFSDREACRAEYVKSYYFDLDPLAAWLMYEVL